jgi:phosphocarrier protein
MKEDGNLEKAKKFSIKNVLGIHARPAGLFAQTASKFDSQIIIEKDDIAVDGKSIMEVMMLGAAQGSSIMIKAKGKDADLALDTLGKLIENKFGEE